MIDALNAVPGYDAFHRRALTYLQGHCWDAEASAFLAWREHPEYRYALDLFSWGYLAFPAMPVRFLAGANRCITTQSSAANGRQITGFCFDTDLDCIWLEGTGQMVVAYQSAGQRDSATFYLTEMEKAMVGSPNDSRLMGVPYVTNRGTIYGNGSLWDNVDNTPEVAATAWYLLGKRGYDPMALGRAKPIPAAISFWR